MKLFLSICLFFFTIPPTHSQIDSVSIAFQGEIEFPSQFLQLKSSIASRIDDRNDDYLYSANLSFGLGIYDISSPSDIQIVLEIGTEEFDGLSVSTIQQIGDYLYVGLGDFQTENPATGLAIFDISDLENPVLQDLWKSEDFIFGVSHLDVYEDIVYMSVMDDGLLILDAQDVTDIKFVSSFIPDLTFPASSDGHHQGRGITKVGDILYYTFDRGGIRSIDVSDIYHPVEIEKYINLDLISKATAAYNDVVVIDNYAYVSVDYCGMEVLDISSSPWLLVDWYDPVDCQGFNWFGAEVHTNELLPACNDSLLFVSGGNSEVIVFDISNPTELKRVGGFFELDNELAAYGLHVLDDKISVSYINNPLNIPYVGNWGGLKVLSFSKHKTTNTQDVKFNNSISLYPNPTDSYLIIQEIENLNFHKANIKSVNGDLIQQYDIENTNNSIDISHLKSGTYLFELTLEDRVIIKRFVKI